MLRERGWIRTLWQPRSECRRGRVGHYGYIGHGDLQDGCHVDNDECDIEDLDDGPEDGLVRYADIASEMMAQLRQEQVDVIIAILML